MKKLINIPDRVVEDMIQGYCLAHPNAYKRVGDRSLVRMEVEEGKVGIVIGGGSGHEPAFLGYVGQGLADGVAIGNIFASPSPEPIVEAARAVHQGAGVLLIYGNYAGDCMNFEMAADLLALEGIHTAQVVVRDDIASAPRDQWTLRRGIAGEVFVYKVAGFLALQGYPLVELARLVQKAADQCVSMGVAWSPCTLPQSGKPSFDIGENDMELGLGVHGEPGIQRVPMVSAQDLSDLLLTRMLTEVELSVGGLAVLINGLGSTSQLELHIFYSSVHQYLQEHGVDIRKVLIGNFITSQEMGGCSVTLMPLDALREEALRAPCKGLGWSQ